MLSGQFGPCVAMFPLPLTDLKNFIQHYHAIATRHLVLLWLIDVHFLLKQELTCANEPYDSRQMEGLVGFMYETAP